MCDCQQRARRAAPSPGPVVDARGPMLAGPFDWVGSAFDWVRGAASDVYEFSQDPAVQAGYAAAAAAVGHLSTQEQRQIEQRAAWIGARYAAIGIQLSPEQAVALARQPDSVIEAELAKAERAVAAQAAAGAGSGAGYAPPVDQPGPAPAPMFGEMGPWLLAGGAALALVLVTSKK